MKQLTEEEMRELLRVEVEKIGSQRAWARAHNLSEPFVNDVLRGRREVTSRVADELGYVKRTLYEPKEEE